MVFLFNLVIKSNIICTLNFLNRVKRITKQCSVHLVTAFFKYLQYINLTMFNYVQLCLILYFRF